MEHVDQFQTTLPIIINKLLYLVWMRETDFQPD